MINKKYNCLIAIVLSLVLCFPAFAGIYGIVYMTLRKSVLTRSGERFEVSIKYGVEAGIPDGSELEVHEIEKGSIEYDQYLTATEQKVGGRVIDASFLDIEINYHGTKIEPKSAVEVGIKRVDGPATDELVLSDALVGDDSSLVVDDSLAEKPRILHFEDNNAITLMESANINEAITFEATSFSVYAVVYTVDFSYNGYEISIKGGSSILLSSLARILSVDGFSVSDVENVEFSNPSLISVSRVDEGTVITGIVVLNGDEIKVSDVAVEGDWVLESLQPFDTEETLVITLTDGKVITITLTDDQDAPMNGDYVQTIANPAGTTIDLFDYWIVSQNLIGKDGWGDLNQSQGAAQAGDDKPLNGTGNNKGINSSPTDSAHGHALKFSPAWAGTVYNGNKIGTTGNAWQSVNLDTRNGLNSYTGDEATWHWNCPKPFTGIVQNNLYNGYPILTENQDIGTTGESLAYLFDPDVVHDGKASYSGVNQFLYVDKNGYYTYDSRDYAALFDKEDKVFSLTEQTSDNSELRGFWPFGSLNYWTGMHVNTNFSMPAGGQVLNPSGVLMPMQFEFSGDDDVWIYVDGILVGDAGGIHNRTEVDINFKTGVVSISEQRNQFLDDLFRVGLRDQGKSDAEIESYIEANFDGHVFKTNTEHTFDFFYLERGGGESNLYIHYNLISTSDFTGHKSYVSKNIDGSANKDDILKKNQFKFELIGYDGEDGSRAIMPVVEPGGNGTVESPSLVYNDEDGYTSLIIGVSEDGNINFGNVNLTNQHLGKKYRYLIREVIPEDAEFVEGQGWVKDGVTYDDTVYYFTGEVQETLTGFKLKKTRFLDAQYLFPDTTTPFNSFMNEYKAEPGELVFEKTDSSGSPVDNAEFTLYTDPGCRHIAKDGDGNNLVTTSQSNGEVKFENIPAPNVYYMKETQKPGVDYIQNDTVYEVSVATTASALPSVITVYGDENSTPLFSISNSKKGEVSVKKEWLDAKGKPMSNSQSVNVTLKRKKTKIPDNLPTNHISFNLHIADPSWGPDYSDMTVSIEKDVVGYNAAIEWYDCWQNFSSLTVTKEDGNPLSTDQYSYWNISENNHSRKMLIYGIDEDVTVNVEYPKDFAWLWQGDDKAKVQAPTIEAGEIQTEIVNDNDFSYPQVTLTSPDYFRIWKTGGNPSNYETEGYDLPAVGDNNRPYYYYFEESQVEGYQTTYTNNEGITEGQVTITNQKTPERSINVIIKKTDDKEHSTNYLSGAVFKLEYRTDSDGTWVNASNENIAELDVDSQFTVPGNADGITLSGLGTGQYRICEVSPPEGYIITKTYPVIFTVYDGAITSTEGTIEGVYYDAMGQDDTFVIPNTPGVELPATGGPGTITFYLFGILLTTLSISMLFFRRRFEVN